LQAWARGNRCRKQLAIHYNDATPANQGLAGAAYLTGGESDPALENWDEESEQSAPDNFSDCE